MPNPYRNKTELLKMPIPLSRIARRSSGIAGAQKELRLRIDPILSTAARFEGLDLDSFEYCAAISAINS